MDHQQKDRTENLKSKELESLLKKPLWRETKKETFSFYCPLCATSRRIPMHPKPDQPIHFARIGLLTFIFTALTWSWFEWKGIVAFIPFWIVFEMVYRAKVRISLNCKKCGFDPTLYLVDAERARDAVRAHWDEKMPRVNPESKTSSLDSSGPNS